MKCAAVLRDTLESMVSDIHSDPAVDIASSTDKYLARFEQAVEAFQNEY